MRDPRRSSLRSRGADSPGILVCLSYSVNMFHARPHMNLPPVQPKSSPREPKRNLITSNNTEGRNVDKFEFANRTNKLTGGFVDTMNRSNKLKSGFVNTMNRSNKLYMNVGGEEQQLKGPFKLHYRNKPKVEEGSKNAEEGDEDHENREEIEVPRDPCGGMLPFTEILCYDLVAIADSYNRSDGGKLDKKRLIHDKFSELLEGKLGSFFGLPTPDRHLLMKAANCYNNIDLHLKGAGDEGSQDYQLGALKRFQGSEVLQQSGDDNVHDDTDGLKGTMDAFFHALCNVGGTTDLAVMPWTSRTAFADILGFSTMHSTLLDSLIRKSKRESSVPKTFYCHLTEEKSPNDYLLALQHEQNIVSNCFALAAARLASGAESFTEPKGDGVDAMIAMTMLEQKMHGRIVIPIFDNIDNSASVAKAFSPFSLIHAVMSLFHESNHSFNAGPINPLIEKLANLQHWEFFQECFKKGENSVFKVPVVIYQDIGMSVSAALKTEELRIEILKSVNTAVEDMFKISPFPSITKMFPITASNVQHVLSTTAASSVITDSNEREEESLYRRVEKCDGNLVHQGEQDSSSTARPGFGAGKLGLGGMYNYPTNGTNIGQGGSTHRSNSSNGYAGSKGTSGFSPSEKNGSEAGSDQKIFDYICVDSCVSKEFCRTPISSHSISKNPKMNPTDDVKDALTRTSKSVYAVTLNIPAKLIALLVLLQYTPMRPPSKRICTEDKLMKLSALKVVKTGDAKKSEEEERKLCQSGEVPTVTKCVCFSHLLSRLVGEKSDENITTRMYHFPLLSKDSSYKSKLEDLKESDVKLLMFYAYTAPGKHYVPNVPNKGKKTHKIVSNAIVSQVLETRARSESWWSIIGGDRKVTMLNKYFPLPWMNPLTAGPVGMMAIPFMPHPEALMQPSIDVLATSMGFMPGHDSSAHDRSFWSQYTGTMMAAFHENKNHSHVGDTNAIYGKLIQQEASPFANKNMLLGDNDSVLPAITEEYTNSTFSQSLIDMMISSMVSRNSSDEYSTTTVDGLTQYSNLAALAEATSFDESKTAMTECNDCYAGLDSYRYGIKKGKNNVIPGIKVKKKKAKQEEISDDFTKKDNTKLTKIFHNIMASKYKPSKHDKNHFVPIDLCCLEVGEELRLPRLPIPRDLTYGVRQIGTLTSVDKKCKFIVADVRPADSILTGDCTSYGASFIETADAAVANWFIPGKNMFSTGPTSMFTRQKYGIGSNAAWGAWVPYKFESNQEINKMDRSRG